MFLYESKQAPYRGLSGNQEAKRPMTIVELKKLPPDQQKMWWGKVCEEPAVAAYLSACKTLGLLLDQKGGVEGSIAIEQAKIDAITDYFAAAKQNANAAVLAEAQKAVIKGCQGLWKAITDNWVATGKVEQGFGVPADMSPKWRAARYKLVKNVALKEVIDQPRYKFERGINQGEIPENKVYFADLPKEVFISPLYGGSINYFAEWFADPVTKEVLLQLYSGNSELSMGLGLTKSLDPAIAAYIRDNIATPAMKLKGVWLFGSSQVAKELQGQKKAAEGVIKLYKEAPEQGLNWLESQISQVKASLPSLLAAITDPLSKAVALEQGKLYVEAGELSGVQDAAAKLAAAAAQQAADAQKVTRFAEEASRGIGSGDDRANRLGTQASASFAGSKRSASNKRNGAAISYNQKGRELIGSIERSLSETPAATPPIGIENAKSNADAIDQQIKGTAQLVIELGSKLKDATNKITDPAINKGGTDALIDKNQEEAKKIVGEESGGFPWWLLLIAAAAAAK